MAIIEAIRNYLMECELLQEFGNDLNVEFLPSEINTFSIEEVPNDTKVSVDIIGNKTCQFTFILASRFIYNDEARQTIDNSGWYEAFANWIDEQDALGNYPDLGEGREATRIEVLTSGYLFNIALGGRDARYQVQLRLTYDIERNY